MAEARAEIGLAYLPCLPLYGAVTASAGSGADLVLQVWDLLSSAVSVRSGKAFSGPVPWLECLQSYARAVTPLARTSSRGASRQQWGYIPRPRAWRHSLTCTYTSSGIPRS